jgi:hypothetical protein
MNRALAAFQNRLRIQSLYIVQAESRRRRKSATCIWAPVLSASGGSRPSAVTGTTQLLATKQSFAARVAMILCAE